MCGAVLMCGAKAATPCVLMNGHASFAAPWGALVGGFRPPPLSRPWPGGFEGLKYPAFGQTPVHTAGRIYPLCPRLPAAFHLSVLRKPNTRNRALLMRLSGQPVFKVRLAASSKRDGDELAWVVNVSPTAAAVWAERACEVAGNAAQNAGAFL